MNGCLQFESKWAIRKCHNSNFADFSENQWQKLWEKLLFGQFCVSVPFPFWTMLRNNVLQQGWYSPKCRLIHSAKNEILIISKHHVKQKKNVRRSICANQSCHTYFQLQKLWKNLLFGQFCVSLSLPLLTMLRNN